MFTKLEAEAMTDDGDTLIFTLCGGNINISVRRNLSWNAPEPLATIEDVKASEFIAEATRFTMNYLEIERR